MSYPRVMDEKQRFYMALEELTPRRRQVLERFLVGKTDGQIAAELVIAESTVRKHIQNISRLFFLEGGDQREALKALFLQYQPERLGESSVLTVPEKEPQAQGDGLPEKIVPMTGVVPVNSTLYIERESDLLCREALQIGSSRQTSVPFLRIKGARGLGKSSLLVRLWHWLETDQKQIVAFVDLGGFNFEPGAFTELNQLLYQFTYAVAHSFSSLVSNLHPPDLRAYWREDVAAASNCTDYLETHVFAKIKQPKTLIIDGIDKVLGRQETQTPFLNLLRSWNERKMKQVGQGIIVWPSLVVAYSTEPFPHYEITDSPLQNVGIQVELEEFDVQQIVDLAKDYYRLELNFNEVKSINQLIGGHPALLNEALYQISQHGLKIYQLENQTQELSHYFKTLEKLNIAVDRTNFIGSSDNKTLPFAYFLQKNLKQLQAHPNLRDCFKKILKGSRCTDEFAKYQLELTGLIRGYPFEVGVSCELYRKFFTAYWELDCEQ